MGKSIRREKIPIAWVKSGKIFPLPNMYSELPSRNAGEEMHGQLQAFTRQRIKPPKSQKYVESQM